jgi:hypothetical protein
VGAGSGTFADRHAGAGKTVSITGLTLAGTDAANYVLSSTIASTTGSIDRAALTVSTVDVVKTYDGAVSANGSAIVTGGQLFASDALSGGAFAFTDRNASAGDKTVTVANVTVNDGNGGNDYDLTFAANTTSTIDRASIAGISGISAQDRIYDGTTAAMLGTGGASFNGMIAGDVLSVGAASGAFADRNAGTGKTVSITDLALAGADAGNYTLASAVASTTASIGRAALTISSADVVKTYDGTLAANGSAVVAAGQLFASDSLSGGTFAFMDKNAGAGDKTVTVANIAVSDGNGGDNYDVTLVANTTSTINRASIGGISGIAAQNRIYDGTTAATLTTGGASFTGMVAGDALSVGAANGAFTDRHAGAGKTVNVSGLVLAGTDAANYVLASTTSSTTASIDRAALAVSTADVIKTYDGTVSANGAAVATAGQLFGSDALSGGDFAFTDRNASSGDKTVTVANVTVNDGNGGNNYDVTLADNTSSTINRAAIASISGIAAQNRIYDGTMAATLNIGGASFNGMIAGDALSVGAGNGTFADRNAGSGKTVSVTGLTLAGADAANYMLGSTTASITANITPATIRAISGIAAQNRMYDGTAAATLQTGGAVFNDMVAGDSLTVASAAGAFDGANPGIGKNVFITGLSLGGTDAGNYVLADDTASATANISELMVPLPLPPASLPDLATPTSRQGDPLASLATPAGSSPGRGIPPSEGRDSVAPNSVRAPALTAMSVVEAPGSAVLITFALSSDGRLTVHVPQDVAVGSLGSEDDLRRLAGEKLGIEPGRILSIQIISGGRPSILTRG